MVRILFPLGFDFRVGEIEIAWREVCASEASTDEV
jgi:hypothetical protein